MAVINDNWKKAICENTIISAKMIVFYLLFSEQKKQRIELLEYINKLGSERRRKSHRKREMYT